MNIAEWLESIDLAEYTAVFEENELEVEDLPELTSDDLRNELGVRNLVHRKKLLAAIGKLNASSPSAKPDWPDGLHPEMLPTFLAIPWHTFSLETHPRVRLHWMVDIAELALRWSVAICLADVLRLKDGQVPINISDRIRDHIERPTLGRWLRILREINTFSSEGELVAASAFELYETTFHKPFFTENQGGNEETSILVMRNHLAHGGGMTRCRAEQLLKGHLSTFYEILRNVAKVTESVDIISIEGGSTYSLKGIKPTRIDRPAELNSANDGLWLLRDKYRGRLLPLAKHAPIQKVEQDGIPVKRTGHHVPQLYARCSTDRISFTPIGIDESSSDDFELAAFQKIFRLDESHSSQSPTTSDGFKWDDFIREARISSEDLIGRRTEIETVKEWLKSRATWDENTIRFGLIEGGPGLGKSLLMDRLVADYSNTDPKKRKIFYHRFRSGDTRNTVQAFLTLMTHALIEWEILSEYAPDEIATELTELEDSIRHLLTATANQSTGHPNASPPEFWVFLDGIDEAVLQVPELAKLIKRLTLPGTVWLAAARPGAIAVDATTNTWVEHIFPSGLPPMNHDDVRAMLLEGLGNGRYALLSRDEDVADEVRNAFVESVTKKAGGLPLYVYFVIEDLKASLITVHDEKRLPDGLSAYYATMMDRIGLSDVKATLPPIICFLAIAKEPLDLPALALLIASDIEDIDIYTRQTEQAIRAGHALLRSAPTADSTDGWTLYHHSFREHITKSAQDGPLSGQISLARRKLVRMADKWNSLPNGNLRNHLFRHGSFYAIQANETVQLSRAFARLTDFEYLQARTACLAPGYHAGFPREFSELSACETVEAQQLEKLNAWKAFFEENSHFLTRGAARWPSNRILLQLALDYANEGYVANSAESWLENGNCNWPLLRMRPESRPPLAARTSGMTVLGHHEGAVNCLAHFGDLLASAGDDQTVRLWDLTKKEPLGKIHIASGPAKFVAFSQDGTTLFTATNKGWIHEHSINSEAEIRSFRHVFKQLLIAFLVEKDTIVLAGDYHIHVWSKHHIQGRKLFGHNEIPRALGLFDQGRKLLPDYACTSAIVASR